MIEESMRRLAARGLEVPRAGESLVGRGHPSGHVCTTMSSGAMFTRSGEDNASGDRRLWRLATKRTGEPAPPAYRPVFGAIDSVCVRGVRLFEI